LTLLLFMRIAILYTELADYTIACLRALKQQAPEAEILVIHFPVNPEAPFRFNLGGIGEFVCLNDFPAYSQFRAKLEAFRPEKILCCGWISKWYIRFCTAWSKKAVCVLALDNHWYNSPKQQLLRIASHLLLKPVFRKIWVPGQPQTVYARKLGFKTEDIITGYYCCDLERYNALYEKFKVQKQQHFPPRLLCVARYIASKNYEMLWRAFIRWKEQTNAEWELWCAGTGELFDQRIQHPAIRHLGFVQKNDWEQVIAQTGIFILPSLSEPWAVAVHEFAAAGYPLLLSNRVGAASQFLDDANGMQFSPESETEMQNCFNILGKLTREQLINMSYASHVKAQAIAPGKWAANLLHA
jgi:glycosyltransferase involved in cell wall biosynthesis